MPERWICLFVGRPGNSARAVFATEEQAKQFAEQHAQVSAPGVTIEWNNSNDPMVLITSLDNHWIIPNG